MQDDGCCVFPSVRSVFQCSVPRPGDQDPVPVFIQRDVLIVEAVNDGNGVY